MRRTLINFCMNTCYTCAKKSYCKLCRIYGKEEGSEMFRKFHFVQLDKTCNLCNLNNKCYYCIKYGDILGKKYKEHGRLFN